MEQNPSVPDLCTGCKSFYATSATNYLCSKCFKQAQAKSAEAKPAAQPEQPSHHVQNVIPSEPAQPAIPAGQSAATTDAVMSEPTKAPDASQEEKKESPLEVAPQEKPVQVTINH